jgi:GxxExxY protein
MEEINRVSGIIVDCAMKVHKTLGPGLLESIYKTCLVEELVNRGLTSASKFLCLSSTMVESSKAATGSTYLSITCNRGNQS